MSNIEIFLADVDDCAARHTEDLTCAEIIDGLRRLADELEAREGASASALTEWPEVGLGFD